MVLKRVYPWDPEGDRLARALSNADVLLETFDGEEYAKRSTFRKAAQEMLLELRERATLHSKTLQKPDDQSVAKVIAAVLANPVGRKALAQYAADFDPSRPLHLGLACVFGRWIKRCARIDFSPFCSKCNDDDGVRWYLVPDRFESWLEEQLLMGPNDRRNIAVVGAAFAMLQPDLSQVIASCLARRDDMMASLWLADHDLLADEIRDLKKMTPKPGLPQVASGGTASLSSDPPHPEVVDVVRLSEIPDAASQQMVNPPALHTIGTHKVTAPDIEQLSADIGRLDADAVLLADELSIASGQLREHGVVPAVTLGKRIEAFVARCQEAWNQVRPVTLQSPDSMPPRTLEDVREAFHRMEELDHARDIAVRRRQMALDILERIAGLRQVGDEVSTGLHAVHNLGLSLRSQLENVSEGADALAEQLVDGTHVLSQLLWLLGGSATNDNEHVRQAEDVVETEFGRPLLRDIWGSRIRFGDSDREYRGTPLSAPQIQKPPADSTPPDTSQVATVSSVAADTVGTEPQSAEGPLGHAAAEVGDTLENVPDRSTFPATPEEAQTSAIPFEEAKAETPVVSTPAIAIPFATPPATSLAEGEGSPVLTPKTPDLSTTIKQADLSDAETQRWIRMVLNYCGEGGYLRAALVAEGLVLAGAPCTEQWPDPEALALSHRVWTCECEQADLPEWSRVPDQPLPQSKPTVRLVLLAALGLYQRGITYIRAQIEEQFDSMRESFHAWPEVAGWLRLLWNATNDPNGWAQLRRRPMIDQSAPSNAITSFRREFEQARLHRASAAYSNRFRHYVSGRQEFRMLFEHTAVSARTVDMRLILGQLERLVAAKLLDGWIRTTGDVRIVDLSRRGHRAEVLQSGKEFLSLAIRAAREAATKMATPQHRTNLAAADLKRRDAIFEQLDGVRATAQRHEWRHAFAQLTKEMGQ